MNILVLIFATAIWGFGFVATRWTLTDFDPAWSNSLRFLLAGLLSLPVLVWKKKLKISFSVTLCSFLLLVGLYLQTMSIGKTSLARSGFFTLFYAIFTPLIVRWIYGVKFRPGYWGLLFSSMVGVALIGDLNWQAFNLGDALAMGSGFLFACHIVAIDRLAQGANPLLFNLQQCFFIGIMSLPLSLFVSGVPDLSPLFNWESLIPPGLWSGLIFLSLFSSIGAFSIQVYAQQGLSAHVVSLVFLAEAVFGALFGYIFFGENLSLMAVLGASVVLVSVALVPVLTRFEKVPKTSGLSSKSSHEY